MSPLSPSHFSFISGHTPLTAHLSSLTSPCEPSPVSVYRAGSGLVASEGCPSPVVSKLPASAWGRRTPSTRPLPSPALPSPCLDHLNLPLSTRHSIPSLFQFSAHTTLVTSLHTKPAVSAFLHLVQLCLAPSRLYYKAPAIQLFFPFPPRPSSLCNMHLLASLTAPASRVLCVWKLTSRPLIPHPRCTP